MVFEDAAVEDDVLELAIEHGRHVIGIFKQFRLDQYVFTVGLWPYLRIEWVHDDRPEHAARDVLDHWRSAAMVKKYPRLFGDKRKVDRLAGIDRTIVLQEVDFGGMKVHGMGVGIAAGICEGELDRIAFGDADDGSGHLTVECPCLIGRP